MKELCRGAEAIIYQDGHKVIKKRIKKGYRIDKIDDPIRSQRTRKEAKVLKKLEEIGIPAPKLLSTDSAETIEMEHIPGDRLADCINSKNVKEIMQRVGEIVAQLHDNGIAHGDLTTSNMIRHNDINLIDFGLSFSSIKMEDKAVDVHLLMEALEAKHYDVYEQAVESFKQGYKNCSDYEKVMKRLEKVEARGRYKGK